MRWAEIRERYPNQWLIVDALEAHTEGDRRKLDQMTVVEVCPDGAAALRRYQELHRQHPQREFYFVHTARQELDIRERYWSLPSAPGNPARSSSPVHRALLRSRATSSPGGPHQVR